MRLFIRLAPFLLLAAAAAGCSWTSPAGPHPPPGVIENPARPDPEAIKRRKLMLIEPGNRAVPTRFEDKR